MKINSISQVSFGNKPKKMVNKVQTKKLYEVGISGLPKEMPLEKKFHIITQLDEFEKIKDKIQITIENMKK